MQKVYIYCSSLAAFLSVSCQSVASLANDLLRAVLFLEKKTDEQIIKSAGRGTYKILIEHPLISHV